MNYLGGITSMAAYYFYHHLARYYPYANDVGAGIRFCTIAILTINFCNTCHCDRHDLQKLYEQEMIAKIRNVISRFEVMSTNGIPIHSSRLTEAVMSLHHILWWGLSTPTTCCYQYIMERNNVEVYQWFMCPGLGTTHRIKNYWIHIMLASLFSHCTSSAIYIVNGKAYFGTCPAVIMFAWGVG
jgi:hypothetical protein